MRYQRQNASTPTPTFLYFYTITPGLHALFLAQYPFLLPHFFPESLLWRIWIQFGSSYSDSLVLNATITLKANYCTVVHEIHNFHKKSIYKLESIPEKRLIFDRLSHGMLPWDLHLTSDPAEGCGGTMNKSIVVPGSYNLYPK